jgi:hypothetical protein
MQNATMWTNLDMWDAASPKLQIHEKSEVTRSEIDATVDECRLQRGFVVEFNHFQPKIGRDTHFKSSDTKREPRGLFLDE